MLRVPQSALTQAPAAQPTAWIFHVAHCGSTLLARALDVLSDDLVLREPLALRQLALLPDPHDLLPPTLALLARRYPGAGPTLIKANVPVNFLLDRIAEQQADAAAVFLHCTLPDYLAAILRSENHRAWLRNVCELLAPHFGPTIPQSDAELAAMLWLAQITRFDAALAGMPNTRSLDAEVFFARPAQVLEAASVLLDTPCAAEQASRLVAGPLFNTYSKNPAHGFGNSERMARRAAILVELGDEIAVAQRWVEDRAPDFPSMLQRLERAALLS